MSLRFVVLMKVIMWAVCVWPVTLISSLELKYIQNNGTTMSPPILSFPSAQVYNSFEFDITAPLYIIPIIDPNDPLPTLSRSKTEGNIIFYSHSMLGPISRFYLGNECIRINCAGILHVRDRNANAKAWSSLIRHDIGYESVKGVAISEASQRYRTNHYQQYSCDRG